MTPVSCVSVETLLGLGRFCGLERSELLHQATLAAGGGILVNYAFFRGFVERADGLENIFLGFGSVFRQGCASLIDSSTGSTAYITVVDTALLVLLVSFDL